MQLHLLDMQMWLTREERDIQGAWSTPISSKTAENTDRSSALSIIIGLVPRILTPFLYKGRARLFGIWPPTDTMTPWHCCMKGEINEWVLLKVKGQTMQGFERAVCLPHVGRCQAHVPVRALQSRDDHIHQNRCWLFLGCSSPPPVNGEAVNLTGNTALAGKWQQQSTIVVWFENMVRAHNVPNSQYTVNKYFSQSENNWCLKVRLHLWQNVLKFRIFLEIRNLRYQHGL